jgi:hypothetical protein
MSLHSKSLLRKILLPLLLLSATLGGCSDMYYDRRETISLTADDARESNRVAQVIDPWPPSSANKNIAFDGNKMQTAVERYRNNKVIQPVNATTSTMAQAQAAAAAAATANGQAAPAAAVKN